ncbi:MAG: T9SS type A sorting domain-containing protein, partial [Lentimicrobium sp.]|nr:T9SS type A sorting domain-containing protein [Lentimicrobium sp.]
SLPEISLYESDNQIYIHCDQTELLPESFEVLNVTGQVVGNYTIENSSSAIISHNLPAGLYFAVFNTKQRPQVYRFAVAK